MSDLKSLKDLVDKLTLQVNSLQTKCDSADYSSIKSDINKCKISLNDREQYARNWSVRINGLSVPRDLIQKYGVDGGCLRHIYDKVIKPTLICSTPEKVAELNLNSGTQLEPQIDFVPSLFSVLENAHFLGGPTKSKKSKGLLLPPAIICRFKSRYFRNLFLRLKRNHMPLPSDAEVARGISYYSVTPDLTRDNHLLLTNLKRDSRVKAAWSIDGHIRFCLLSNDKIKYQVNDVYRSVEDIISSCATAASNTADIITSIVKQRGSSDNENSSTADESSRRASRNGGGLPERNGSRSPVQAELRGGRIHPPPVGTRKPGIRAEVETSKIK